MRNRLSPPALKLLAVSIVVVVALVAVVVWAVTTRADDDARVSTVQDARIQSVLSACAAPDSGLRSPGVGVLDISYPGGEPTDIAGAVLLYRHLVGPPPEWNARRHKAPHWPSMRRWGCFVG